MLNKNLDRFLRDESGGYTIWGLTWFMLYVGIGGLAVDMTDGFRTQSLLQATADSAALAAVMSVGVTGEDPVAQANQYAAVNMPETLNGDVLADTDITVGTWNYATRTFTAGGTEPNAVHVITRRSDDNANPVATNFLRIVGFQRWNVGAEAIAIQGINTCQNNGIVAGGVLDIKTHTRYWNEICLIGNSGVYHRSNENYFEPGVYVGAGCEEPDCIGRNFDVATREVTFTDAFDLDLGGNYSDPTLPLNAYNTQNYINAALDTPNHANFDAFATAYNGPGIDYSASYDYLFNPSPAEGVSPVSYVEITGVEVPAAITTDAGKYTVYNFDCVGDLELPSGTYRNVAIIANCRLVMKDDPYDMADVLLASTSTDSRGAFSTNSSADFGTPGCGNPGVELYTVGDIHFASGGGVANTRILSLSDVHFAAGAQGPVGVHIEAVGDVFTASGSNSGADMGLCPGGSGLGPKVTTRYGLVL